MISKIKRYIGKRFSKQIDIIYALRTSVLKYLFYLCRVRKEKIVFINFNGRGFGCNPKYIALELLERNAGYNLVWLVDKEEEPMPKGIRKVLYSSVRALYEVATAKVIVTNVKNDLRLIKKKEQYVIQTWHASFGSKAVEAQAADKLSARYIEESKRNSAQTDLFLSNSRMMSECYRKAFWCECEIMEGGLPRNDVLFNAKVARIDQIRASLNLSDRNHYVLYAPTFRDDGSTEAYGIDCLGILDALNNEEQKWQLLIRMHPNVGKIDGIFPEHEDIVDVTSYPDMQELLLISDILITDYSSTVFEFAAMGKQSYVVALDLDEYQRLRGLTPEFFQLPNTICRTNAELLKEMQKYTPEGAKASAEHFMKMVGGVDDGHASERVADRIEQVIWE